MIDYVKSPLNYTGNKFRILDQIFTCFPPQIDCMVDMFCGGATVGLNANAKRIIFVDNNERVINLLIYLSRQSFSQFLSNCEKIISKYNLSYSYKYGYKIYRKQCSNQADNNGLKDYNAEGYYRLRNDYNQLSKKNTDDANIMLYMLMVYGFNNDIRFNSNGEFNLPIGKTDLNKNNIEKVKSYIARMETVQASFICASFMDDKIQEIVKQADFVYMDPPYLVGNAVYNSSWDSKLEHALLDFIDNLMENKIKFALSNVTEKVGKINEPLSYWCHKNGDKIIIHPIEYHYRSASYHKTTRNAKEQEVVITNAEYKSED